MPSSEEPSQEKINFLASLYTAGKTLELLIECESLENTFPTSTTIPSFIAAANSALGRHEQAISAYEKVLRINPSHAETHNNLGVALKTYGKIERAVENYKKAIECDPDFIDAYNNLANALKILDRFDEAVNCYKLILQLTPNDDDIYCNIANCLKVLDKNEEAIVHYQHALRLKKDNHETYFNLAGALSSLDRYDEAINCYSEALQLNPEYADAHNNLGSIFFSLEKYDEAIISFSNALRLKPHFIEAYNNMGCALNDMGKPDESLGHYHLALRIEPDNAEINNNLSVALRDLGESGEAIGYCNCALETMPDFAEAHLNLAHLRLQNEDLVQGWIEYEWRMQLQTELVGDKFRINNWRGGSLSDESLLIIAEQGVGDEVMFASCIPDLCKDPFKAITLLCDERLQSLFARSFPSIKVVDLTRVDELKGNVELSCHSGSLPGIFRSETSQFPVNRSYLIPDPVLVERWSNRFSELPENMTIGLSWRGGKSTKDKLSRSIELSKWQTLLNHKANFVNLQYGQHAEEVANLSKSAGISIYNWEDASPLNNLENFAAQISALDLVISIDNSTVHLAGALGVPTWTLLPFNSDWRWFLEREDSPWYPSLRLFRQKQRGNWDTVIARVTEELGLLVKKQTIDADGTHC